LIILFQRYYIVINPPAFIMITSSQNPKIQWVRSLQSRSRQRREAGAFVIEGVRLVEEALVAGYKAQLVLYSNDLSLQGQELVRAFETQGAPVEQVSSKVMRAASDTDTPQGILVVLPMIAKPPPETLTFVLIPESVRDPGNLGTMLRTAEAASVDSVFLPEGTVDAYAPKVLRSAMGAHFRLPVVSASWEAFRPEIKATSLKVFLADARGGERYTQADLSAPLALVVSGETEGPSANALDLADAHLHIPMPGGAESLNVAIAASILMFEVVRQRSLRSLR
jgi:TrmH family RNA methyltransferase